MVSERRPHWDDDLINAVRTAMRPRILTCADTIDTYDVIAAVEEQHYAELREQAERAGQGLDVEALISARMEQVARAENAEAAIARVRELADRVARYHGDGLPRIKPRDIYRALDGER